MLTLISILDQQTNQLPPPYGICSELALLSTSSCNKACKAEETTANCGCTVPHDYSNNTDGMQPYQQCLISNFKVVVFIFEMIKSSSPYVIVFREVQCDQSV